MKPYDFISEITEDVIAEYFQHDYCYAYFEDHIRYDRELATSNLSNYQGDDKKLAAHATLKTRHSKNFEVEYFEGHVPQVNKSSSPFFHHDKWIDTTQYSTSSYKRNFNNIFYEHSWEPIETKYDSVLWESIEYQNKKFGIQGHVIHSEYAGEQLKQIEKLGLKTIHWFAHAYICSEFYFKHYPKLSMVTDYMSRPINYPWLSANRLLRDYRVEFLQLLDYTQGAYSLLEQDATGKRLWGKVPPSSFDHHNNDSAEINISKLTPWNTSFLHIVNETRWQDRIHFTEKVFKPIVMHQPFVVLQAPGSLEYLRSYGFKTFGDFWDESYDTIEDPNARMQAIADIVNWIPTQDLYRMRNKMSGILEHNFRHFYEKIPDIVLDELRVAIQLASS